MCSSVFNNISSNNIPFERVLRTTEADGILARLKIIYWNNSFVGRCTPLDLFQFSIFGKNEVGILCDIFSINCPSFREKREYEFIGDSCSRNNNNNNNNNFYSERKNTNKIFTIQ